MLFESLRLLRVAVAAFTLSLAACATPPVSAAATTKSGLSSVVVTLHTSTGKRHRYQVELARTSAEQARGLMFRKTMPRDAGMIFPMSPPRFASFWMENTFLPLDIIFIAPDGKVLNIVQGEPLSRRPLDSVAIAGSVLELNAGEAARIGLEPGDAVDVRY